jgi:hypothetical protein
MSDLISFKDQGYCVIRNAISTEIRDFVTQYSLFLEMQLENKGDSQVPDAASVYADPAMETILLMLHPLIEKHTELKIDPTYSYFRVYRKGDELKKHIDRPSCEISATLCFNYDYGNLNYDWPIFINEKKIDLSPGDLAIYRGCDLEHWREKFDPNFDNAWQVQGFFHFVDQNGPYAEWKYDRRNSIGESKIIHQNNKSYIEYVK